MMTKKIILYTVIISITGLGVYYFYSEKKLPENAQIDKILVYKCKRQMLVYSNGTLLKTYRISLGRNPIGTKEFQGDRKTPEGTYFINDKNPFSCYGRGTDFHKSQFRIPMYIFKNFDQSQRISISHLFYLFGILRL
jgi:hypothetical protein